MVLARHVGQPGLDVLRGLICAAVAVLQLGGLCALTERQQLMPQADAEGRDAVAHEFAQIRNHGGVIRRVAGAVGQHQSVGIQVQDFLRRRARRNNRDRTAALFEFTLDVRLCAEVPEDDVVDSPLLRGLNAVARHVLNRRMERQHLQLRADFLRILRLLGQQRGIHHARIADNAGQRAGVHPVRQGMPCALR